MRTKEKIQFIKRLSFLVRAGIPLETCLSTLEAQATSRSAKKFLKILLDQVRSGSSLSEALKNSGKKFGAAASSVLRVGEESGTLSEALGHLVIVMEKSATMRSKIILALLYPVLIACATLALTGFLILYIFPKITPIFASLKVPLPVATRILIGASAFVRENFIWLLASGAALCLGLFLLMKFSSRTRLEFSKILMKIPFIGRLVQIYVLARISVLLGTLLGSHMKVDEAIALVSESVGYPVYKKFFRATAVEISHGTPLSHLCSKNRPLFPPLFANMIAVGEMSGSLADVLKDLAVVYESELDGATKAITQMIEPILMVFMSALVGFVAISIITPLYNITSNLRH